jgi:hypothetical protein
LRGIFRSTGDEITGGLRELGNEGLHNLYSSLHIITMMKSRRVRGTGHEERIRAKGNVYKILVGSPEGKRLLGRPRCRWVDNIIICLIEIG